MSLSAAAPAEATVTTLRFLDVVVVVVAAPIMLLIGVPAAGYLIGAGAWIALRVAALGVERAALASPEPNRQISIRMGFMLGRLFLLALAVILARQSSQDDGLTALVVVVFAYTLALALSAVHRPRRRR